MVTEGAPIVVRVYYGNVADGVAEYGDAAKFTVVVRAFAGAAELVRGRVSKDVAAPGGGVGIGARMDGSVRCLRAPVRPKRDTVVWDPAHLLNPEIWHLFWMNLFQSSTNPVQTQYISSNHVLI